MNAPIRWKDDASFLAETGLDLSDEGAGVGNYALDSMRSGVLVHTGRSWMAKAAPWIGGSVVVLVVAWMAWPSPPLGFEAPPETVHIAAPGIAEASEQVAPAAAPVVAPVQIASSPVQIASSPVQNASSPVQIASPPPVSPPSPPMALAPPIVAPGEAEEAPVVAASDLSQQLDVYRQGQAALQSGDLSAAAEAFQRYLEAWPEGQVRDEVLVSVLEIVIQRQQWSQVQTLAGQLEEVPALTSRHQEFRRVRAQALSQLDRCPEALKLVESLPRPDALAVKQRCRRAQ